MKKLKKFKEDESGAIMIVIAVGMTVFLTLAALVTDLGLAYYEKSKLQTALDSAALASVYYVKNHPKATEVAKEYVEKNGFDSSDLQVQFINQDTVRVSMAFESKTIFADVFTNKPVKITNVAAAKMSQQAVVIDFPYRLYQGGPSVFNLGGGFAIEGNVHTNGGIKVSGGSVPYGTYSPYGDSKSYIHGMITGVSPRESDYTVANVWNVGKFYYNWWSTNAEGSRIGVDYVSMPDYDAMIMEIAPSFDINAFFARIDNNKYYTYNTTVSSNITINGDCYCNGNFSTSSRANVNITGSLYVNGKIFLDGGSNLHVGHDIYSSGDMNMNGGLTVDSGVVYSGGDFITASGSPIVVNGVIIAEDYLDFGGMPVHLAQDDTSTLSVYSRHGDIRFNGSANGTSVYGMIYAPNGKVTIGSGGLHFYGNVIGETLSVSSGGLTLGENTRPLPFTSSEMMATLIE